MFITFSYLLVCDVLFFFFFQAEDGIRDHCVTGVQTCALPIPKCTVTVFPDRAPTVKVVTPEDEIAVRPDDRVTIEFEAKDDFGVAKAELLVFSGPVDDESAKIKTIDIPLGEKQGEAAV